MCVHPKVWIWWGSWWAVQLIWMPEVSLGLRLRVHRPLLDIYLGPLTIALGHLPHCTEFWAQQAYSCRGFFVAEKALL